jgi:DNA-binding HxlR family transcriptional regulator
VLDYYIAHREEREQQVLAALAAGPQPLMELVRVVYAEVNPDLHPLAAQSLLAHLQKLEREGRVHRQEDAAGHEQWSLGA